MGKLHRDNAGYVGCSYEDTQDPFWSYNKLALPLDEPSGGVPITSATGALPILNTTDTYGLTQGAGVRTDSTSGKVWAVALGNSSGLSLTDQSGNGYNITNNGSLAHSSSEFKYYGGSMYITNAATGSFSTSVWNSIASGQYTIEFWIKLVSTSMSDGYASTVVSCRGDGDNNPGFFSCGFSGNNGVATLYIGNSGNYTHYVSFDGTQRPFPVGQWVHVAQTRDASNVVRTFMNGQVIASTTSSATISSINRGLIGGNDYGSFTSAQSFYLNDMRFYSTAKYTASFTVPEKPKFRDLSPSRHTLSETSATWQTSVSKFYGGATNFGGSSWVTLASSSDFAYGTGDFTIEFWVYQYDKTYDNSSNQRILDSVTSSIVMDSTGDGGRVRFDTGGGNYYSTSAYPENQWYHIAIVRSAGTLTFYKNGSPDGSSAVTTNIGTPGGVVYVSRYYGDNSGKLKGYLQDLRVYKGIAKYTTSFTPPTRSLLTQARRYPSGVYVVS